MLLDRHVLCTELAAPYYYNYKREDSSTRSVEVDLPLWKRRTLVDRLLEQI